MTKSSSVATLHRSLVKEMNSSEESFPHPIRNYIYAAYRRASFDVSGAPFVLFECPEAKNFIFDFLQQIDPFGFVDASRWFLEGSIRGIGTSRLAIEGQVTYTLEFMRRNHRYWYDFRTADNEVPLKDRWLKVKIQHPANPKLLVLHALTPVEPNGAGLYDFRLSAEVELKCVGPTLICEFWDIKAMISDLRSLGTADFQELLAKEIFKYYNKAIKVSKDLAMNAAKRLYKGRPKFNCSETTAQFSTYKAVAEARCVLIPVMFPDLVGLHECEARDALEDRGLTVAVDRIPKPSSDRNQEVIATQPTYRSGAPPESLVFVDVYDSPDKPNYPCNRAQVRFRDVKKGVP